MDVVENPSGVAVLIEGDDCTVPDGTLVGVRVEGLVSDREDPLALVAADERLCGVGAENCHDDVSFECVGGCSALMYSV
jgi:hypothetical protein